MRLDSSRLAPAIHVVEALIRTLFNENPYVLMQHVYDKRDADDDPFLLEKLGQRMEGNGGVIRWLGSLDEHSLARLTAHSLARESDQLRQAIELHDDEFNSAFLRPKLFNLVEFLR